MLPLLRFILPALMMLSSKAGAAGAGLTGSLLVVGVAAGQVPVPAGLTPAETAAYVGIGPSVVWLFTRIVASFAAFWIRRRDNRNKRLADMMAVPHAERDADSGKVMRKLREEADRADEISAALEAFRTPTTNGGGK